MTLRTVSRPGSGPGLAIPLEVVRTRIQKSWPAIATMSARRHRSHPSIASGSLEGRQATDDATDRPHPERLGLAATRLRRGAAASSVSASNGSPARRRSIGKRTGRPLTAKELERACCSHPGIRGTSSAVDARP